ncbi:MAG TPA: type III-A CRISPR-associated RAMP protein Csm4 [Chloroflexia bacterium]|nr:type III-A CRISPR-associated RAMP protein Csm4 [Chloroflexia bacterium]
MADVWAYRLTPRRAFHFGVRGVGVEASAVTAASDLLFGALCQGLRATAGWDTAERGLARLLDACEARQPPFLVSSLFPFAGAVRLLPRPLQPLGGAGAAGGGKDWRKVAYLSWGRWGALYGAPAGVAPPAFDREDLLQGRQAWVTAAEREALAVFRDPEDPVGAIRLWQEGDSPRVTIDRRTSESQVYQAGWVAFPPGAGLYFLMEWRDPAWQPAIHAALAYLAEEGIGGERSSGYGQFTLAIDAPVPLPAPPTSPAPAAMTLSLYHPTAPEVVEAGLLAAGAYGLTTRRGWVGAPGALGVRRRDVLMLTEGSVLPFQGAGPFGNMVDVTPETWPPGVREVPGRLRRYGFALPLPLPAAPEEVPDAPH